MVLKRKCLSALVGPMTPLFSNPEFPPTLEATHFFKWNSSKNTRIVQTLVNGKLSQLAELGQEYEQKWMQYWQLYTYIGYCVKFTFPDQ